MPHRAPPRTARKRATALAGSDGEEGDEGNEGESSSDEEAGALANSAHRMARLGSAAAANGVSRRAPRGPREDLHMTDERAAARRAYVLARVTGDGPSASPAPVRAPPSARVRQICPSREPPSTANGGDASARDVWL